ncbi:MAG: polysulfide reductase NrfD [Magnetococcales bacterium]|nr:polysulfide reductase NrfD [Magnetococcales bacterium]MBF0604949.1 polysulfide reductase NrfD [Magnetococcales bacterium]HAT50139.1 molybdopterin oxidoreductase [Alphaproteobacteria bacterium]
MLSEFSAIEGRSPRYWMLVGLFALVLAVGMGAFLAIEVYGHGITGMNNQVVWGMPHVFAISLLVMASGALNLGSMSTVFATVQFKQFTRFSAFLAIVLLVGGLTVLLLDLGRPDRLLLPMLHMNFRSMFTWNVFLYSGFLVLCLLYLWSMFSYKQFTKVVGSAAFAWRVILTTGTGSIFGVIQARDVFHSAITGPMFVAVSLTSGTALSTILLVSTYRRTGRHMDEKLVFGLRNALIFFTLLVGYLFVVEKFTKMYSPAFYDVELWLFTGPWAKLYWFGVWGCCVIFPLMILFNGRWGNTVHGVMAASGITVVGVFAFVAHVLLAGQSFPFDMFPGYQLSSVFLDGVDAVYTPALVEFALGFGGIALSGILFLLGIKFFRLLPGRAVAPKGWELPWSP